MTGNNPEPATPGTSSQVGPVTARQGRRLWWLAFWAFWTAFGLLLAAPRVLFVWEGTGRISRLDATLLALLDMYSWSLVALAGLWLARVIPVGRGEWGRAIALHFAAGLAVLTARFWGANGLVVLLGWSRSLPEPLHFVNSLPFNLLFYFSLVGVGYATEFYRRYRDRELRASQLALETSRLELAATALEARVVEAQLQALKSQIQPHFLFNTLNAIATLIHHDPQRAEQMIAHLSDLLRSTLVHRQDQEVTLQEELELLQPYLEIEQTRFGDRLVVRVDAPSEVLQARVPHLLLQPLIENSIRHGIAPRVGRGMVTVRAAREDGRLSISVEDDGIGLSDEDPLDGGGIGLSNIRARLTQLYGEEGQLRIFSPPAGGTVIELDLPFRRSPGGL